MQCIRSGLRGFGAAGFGASGQRAGGFWLRAGFGASGGPRSAGWRRSDTATVSDIGPRSGGSHGTLRLPRGPDGRWRAGVN